MQNKMSLIGNPPNRAVRRFIGRTLPDLTGFPRDRTDSTITVAGNVLTIAPVGASFTYWHEGREVTKTAAESITISDVEGEHYIYYDENDVLQESATFDIDYIYTQALVAIVYWDATNNVAIHIGDERHGRVMSAETHAHLHLTLGAQWITGLALDGFTIGNGALATHAQFGFTAGQMRDEDLEHDNLADAAPATIPVFYKSGVTGVWRRRAANTFPLLYSGDGSGYVGANGRIAFNEFSGGAWVLTQVSANNNFALTHYFVTNDPDQPVIAVVGEVEYTNITAAREGATTELNTIITAGLPFVEFAPLGTVIFQTSAAYANTPKARVVQTDLGGDYVDFRGFKFASTGSPSSHAVLGDLAFAASGHIGFQPVIFEDAGDPDANDDIAGTGGNGVFLTGYFWRNTTSGDVFICVDDTATAAVWREVAIQLSSPTLSDLYLTDGGEVGNAAAARLTFDSSGATDYAYFSGARVGINDTTPDAQLDVVCSGAAVIGQIIEAAAAQTANLLEINTNGGSGGDLVVVDASGNVGVGVDPDADAKIHTFSDVAGFAIVKFDSAATNSDIRLTCYSDTTTDSSRLLLRKSHSDTHDATVETIDTETIGQIIFSGVDSAPSSYNVATIRAVQVGAAVATRVAAQLQFETSSTGDRDTRMTIEPSGDVNILNDLKIGGAVGDNPAAGLELADAKNIAVGTTTGTQIGTAAAQKLGFYGATPVVQRPKASYNNWAALSDVVNALVDLGLFDSA